MVEGESSKGRFMIHVATDKGIPLAMGLRILMDNIRHWTGIQSCPTSWGVCRAREIGCGRRNKPSVYQRMHSMSAIDDLSKLETLAEMQAKGYFSKRISLIAIHQSFLTSSKTSQLGHTATSPKGKSPIRMRAKCERLAAKVSCSIEKSTC